MVDEDRKKLKAIRDMQASNRILYAHWGDVGFTSIDFIIEQSTVGCDYDNWESMSLMNWTKEKWDAIFAEEPQEILVMMFYNTGCGRETKEIGHSFDSAIPKGILGEHYHTMTRKG